MEQFDRDFLPLIRQFDRDQLANNASSVFGFWPDLTVAYLNNAWFRFAAENGGEPDISTRWGIGARLTEAISPPLDEYYARRFRRCLADAKPWDQQYECSSAEHFRKLHMIVYPLEGGRGGLVVNSLVMEARHDPVERPARAPALEHYVDEHGSVHQCMHCRRTQSPAVPQRWDWVPAWVAESPSNTSHGLCEACLDFYYPELEDDLAAMTP
jgi:hypothetical protein